VLRVAGVPEHFNLPWRSGVEHAVFDKYGVKVEFIEISEGTGAMIAALKEGRVDLIIALTEGLVADIAKGSDVRLVGTYVQSPLCWAVSTGASSSIQCLADLEGKMFGISRYGSGSHIMAMVMAAQRGWTKPPQFKVVGNFQNLRDSVNKGETDAFMWETFTTKPFHDSGEVRRVGDVTTPWPCFMVAGLQQTLAAKADATRAALSGVNEAAFEFRRNVYGVPRQLVVDHGLSQADAEAWYRQVDIRAHGSIAEGSLESVLAALKDAGTLAPDAFVQPDELVAPAFCRLEKDLKSMGLYSLTSLLKALQRRLHHSNLTQGTLPYTAFNPYDINIYHHTQGIESALQAAAVQPGSRVVSLGAGTGGVARYLAGKHGCKVLASEIQEDLHHAASELTQRAVDANGGALSVQHLLGDFIEVAKRLPHNYDHIMSWLTVLHFSDRPALYKTCLDTLRPGGTYYAGDFVLRRTPTAEETTLLRDRVGCPGLAASIAEYTVELQQAGFENVMCKDVTEDWTQFAIDRYNRWRDDADLRQVIGADVHSSLCGFFDIVASLFESGCISGIEATAAKPLGW
jgi:sulfonate transport system substrate-binding protein